MDKLQGDIKRLYSLQKANYEWKHGTKFVRANEEWSPNPLTRFAFAYFAFNSFYNINWEETISQSRTPRQHDESDDFIVYWDREEKTEPQKARELIKFICNCYDEDVKELASAFREILKEFLYESARSEEPISFEDAADALEGIQLCGGGREENKSQFIKGFQYIVFEEEVTKGKFISSLINIAYCTSITRNNIFHGTKTALDAMESAQSRRLDIYAALITTINELLFKVLGDKFHLCSRDLQLPRLTSRGTALSPPSFTDFIEHFKLTSCDEKERGDRLFFLRGYIPELQKACDTRSEYPESNDAAALFQELFIEKPHTGRWAAKGNGAQNYEEYSKYRPNFLDPSYFDPYVALMVESLNLAGFVTCYSCQGKPPRNNCYIDFSQTYDLILIKLLLEGDGIPKKPTLRSIGGVNRLAINVSAKEDYFAVLEIAEHIYDNHREYSSIRTRVINAMDPTWDDLNIDAVERRMRAYLDSGLTP